MRVMTSLIVLFAVFALTGPALAQRPSVEMPGMGPNPRLPQPDRAASVFRNGKTAGPPEGFLTGFMANPRTGEAYGRPVGVAMLADGSLLVADDAGNTVWRVQAAR
jgi:hypothetical protein